MIGHDAADPMRSLSSTEDVDAAAVSGPVVVLFKHSPLCGTSSVARRQVLRFAGQNPETPIYIIDVVNDRPVSQYIAERFGVRHQSPQVIVLRDSRHVWNGSHFRVTARALRREVERA